jgi:hypothetical protein
MAGPHNDLVPGKVEWRGNVVRDITVATEVISHRLFEVLR